MYHFRAKRSIEKADFFKKLLKMPVNRGFCSSTQCGCPVRIVYAGGPGIPRLKKVLSFNSLFMVARHGDLEGLFEVSDKDIEWRGMNNYISPGRDALSVEKRNGEGLSPGRDVI